MNRQQLGTTMIELMISMALGLAIIAGISEIFLQSQKSAKIQTAMSHMMEDGGYLTEMFSKELRRAGFLRTPKAYNGATVNIFGADANSLVISTSSLPRITMAQGEAIHGATDDAFVYRYQLNDLTDDPGVGSSPCTQDLGLDVATTATDNPETNVQLVTVFFYQTGGSLNCRAKRELVTPGIGISGAASAPTAVACQKPAPSGIATCLVPGGKPIIENVERLLVKYGVDSDCDGTANFYTTADQVTALTIVDAALIASCRLKPLIGTSAWQLVVAAKIFVVLYSESNDLTKTAGTFSIEGVACNGTGLMACPATTFVENGVTKDQRRIYRVFSTTVAFRN